MLPNRTNQAVPFTLTFNLLLLICWAAVADPSTSATEPAASESECRGDTTLTPVCGLQRPEDLELLPDNQTILVSVNGTA